MIPLDGIDEDCLCAALGFDDDPEFEAVGGPVTEGKPTFRDSIAFEIETVAEANVDPAVPELIDHILGLFRCESGYPMPQGSARALTLVEL